MTPPIQRVRYFDGEYLRAGDFQAEQAYHIEMRRRLNMALHLFGIVEGLQLQGSGTGGPSVVSIAPGMAIDAYGREMFLLSPYGLNNPVDIDANRIKVDGTYDIYLRYRAVAENPPAEGYARCDQSAELTRTHETCDVVLLPQSGSPASVVVPQVTDAISEVPETDASPGVYLGQVVVTLNDANGTFSVPTQPTKKVVYVGLRAQRLEPPNFAGANDPAFDPKFVLNGHNSVQPAIGIDVASNLFVDENAVIGENFAIAPPPAKPPAGFPAAAGNLKVASDLFVKGSFYFYVPNLATGVGTWLDLPGYVKQLSSPDIRMGTFTVSDGGSSNVGLTSVDNDPLPVVVAPSSMGNGSCTLTLKSSLAGITKFRIVVSIAGVSYLSRSIATTTITNEGTMPRSISLTTSTGAPNANPQVVTVAWVTSPKDGSTHYEVQSLTISYVAVFYP
jgi:hypothetical protein